ncbi:MAG: alpha/beta hydrolase [Mariniphaga sp.]
MKNSIFSTLLITFTIMGAKSQPIELPVWPKGAPNSNEIPVTSKMENGKSVAVDPDAKIFVYLPESKSATAAIVICPGGGYGGLAMSHEGHEVAKWLNTQGVAAIVLKYRMPNGHHQVPLSDAQQALRIVRENASKWNINKNKVGISGFSAGGHLASTVATHFTDGETRPDFAILFYPVISSDTTISHRGSFNNLLGKNPAKELYKFYSNELQVTPQTPPTLLFHSDDDHGVPVQNSIGFYLALKRNKVPASMYIFPVGGHGWGMKESFIYHQQWMELMVLWLKGINIL